jgi:hypothetical protein
MPLLHVRHYTPNSVFEPHRNSAQKNRLEAESLIHAERKRAMRTVASVSCAQ